MRQGVITPPRRKITRTHRKFNETALIRKDDVVVVRVAKNAGAAQVVKKEYIGWHVSDCIIIVRYPALSPNNVSKLLNNALQKKRKGLAAQYITKADIANTLLKHTARKNRTTP